MQLIVAPSMQNMPPPGGMTAIVSTLKNDVCLPVKVTQEKILALHNNILKLPQVEIVTKHTFLPGIYERTMIAPYDTVIVGAAHKTPYKVRLEKGVISVNIGTEIRTLSAPMEFSVEAGAQRVGYVRSDEVVWVDVYDNPDDCRNLDEIEARLFEIPECGLLDNRLKAIAKEARDDFALLLSELDMTQNQMDKVVQTDVDLMAMPPEYCVELKASNLHGKGLFVTKAFTEGELVAPMRLNGKRTPAGRFINHSLKCNVKPIKIGDNMYVVAARFISAGEELLLNYRDSLKVNFGLVLQGDK